MNEMLLVVQQIGFPIFAAIWLLVESRSQRKAFEERFEKWEQNALARENELRERVRELEIMKDQELKIITRDYKEAIEQITLALRQSSASYGRLEQAVRELCKEALWGGHEKDI